MSGRRTRTAIGIVLALTTLAGCHSGDSETYPTWAADPKTYTPRSGSTNAFDAYATAAAEAEEKGADYLTRVSFYPGQKKEAGEAIKNAVETVVKATKQTCDFQFTSHKPFQPVKYQAGWRLIGRAILWKVEDGCQAADFDKAINAAVAGTRFGFDLTAGGATDASLGLAIADDVRKAIAPYMIKMSQVQLDRLAKGIKKALDAKPTIVTAIRNEHENALQSIQFLQDSMRGGTLNVIQTQLGTDVNEAVKYLEPLASNPHKRKVYFEGLAAAAEAEFKAVEGDSDVAVSARDKTKPKLDEPWKKFAKHVYGAARPLLAINDATVARTRLLILSAQLTRLGLRNKSYPSSLKGFTKALTIDPYSGVPFLYHADQSEFSLYSVGADGRDDGGDTDSTYTKPDLRLECPIQ